MNLPMIPQDKANHFIYGLLIASITGSVLAPLGGLFICTWLGLLKELVDRFDHKPSNPSFADFLATMAGGVVYYVITLTV